MDRVFELIRYERKKQDEKWGVDRNLSSFEWLTVLTEEVGECAKAILKRDNNNLKREIIQVAAIAVAWMEDIFKFDINEGIPSKGFKAG